MKSISRLVLSDCMNPMDCTPFSRQEYWSGLPFPSPGHLPDPGIEPGSPALQVDSLPSEPPGKPFVSIGKTQILHRNHSGDSIFHLLKIHLPKRISSAWKPDSGGSSLTPEEPGQ